ncbi:MAG: hypothetical protein ACLRPX_02085 [Ruthenibacterium sp.]
MKKLIALVLVVTLLTGLLAGCTGGSSSSVPGSAAGSAEPQNNAQELPEPWKLGIPDMRAKSTDPTWGALIAQVELLASVANGEIVYLSGSTSTAEGSLENVEQAIALGCDGLMIMPVTDSIMPTVSQKCQEAGMYFASMFRKIQDPDTLALLEENPYWCGWTIEKEYEEGYNVMTYLHEQGVSTVAFYGQEVGDACSDMREAGMRAAAEELGVDVVAEVRNLGSTTEIHRRLKQSLAAADLMADHDLLLRHQHYRSDGRSHYSGGQNGEIKLGTDMTISQADLFDAGKLDISAGGQHIINAFLTAASLVNFIVGTPLDPDGKPNYTEDSYVYAYSGDDIRQFFQYYGGEDGSVMIYNEDEIKELALKWFNPELTQEDFYALGENWSLEDLITRHGE